MSTKQALDVVNALAEKCEAPSACLDGKFWVWESLEEALRGEVENLSIDDYISTLKVFHTNYKGSQDFTDLLEYRVYREGDPLGK